MRRKNITSEMMKSYIAESLLLLMSKKSYHKITICEIIEKAGVNRSTYYRNFKSKEDILSFWFSNIMEEYHDHVKTSIDLYEFLCGMYNTLLNYKKQLLLIYKQGMFFIFLDTLNDFFSKRIINLSRSEFFEKFKIYFSVGAIYNSLMLWVSNDMNPSSEEFAKMAITIQKNISLKPLIM